MSKRDCEQRIIEGIQSGELERGAPAERPTAKSLYRQIAAAHDQWQSLGEDLQKEYRGDFHEYLAPWLAAVIAAERPAPNHDPDDDGTCYASPPVVERIESYDRHDAIELPEAAVCEIHEALLLAQQALRAIDRRGTGAEPTEPSLREAALLVLTAFDALQLRPWTAAAREAIASLRGALRAGGPPEEEK